MPTHDSAPSSGPLTGLRILELGHFVAAPFGSRLLADLGADVIKVEAPGGDPVRQWGRQVEGAGAPWTSMHQRNKRSLVLNLKDPRAVEVVLRLVRTCDAVIENFRPGQLAKMGLGREAMEAARPGIVVASISGYGQDGLYRDRAAFGVIGEAIGGLRYLTNHPPSVSDLPPVRVGVSIGDSIAGLYAAFGIVAALWARDRKEGGDGRGRAIDVALTESVLSMMEGMLPEYGVFGSVRHPTGARIATASPSSAYPTADGKWILIAGNSEPIFARLTALMGQPELAQDPRFIGNGKRVANVEDLDRMIGAWSATHSAADLERMLAEADVPSTIAYTAAEIAADPQFRARGMVQEVEDPQFGTVLHAGIVPHVPDDPGRIRWPGPRAGEHTDAILRDVAGLDADAIGKLREDGVAA
ncbi:L-carnitine dehydratase/bile acid-inducible protein F [Methylobacterium sp. 4-46]|uniref:CaiB/BaiF CoA transferase family protein n=1 Tax=unclassified Methylobacterium TaxID=2615210 RepID=UPI000152E40F|nr:MULTISPECIES: CoA transferase [Methylobacterium]ACA16393.1 L-carnitine dehydratase/bile acid-inducible protein F [Methylobacterium sp. 4-46]WFT82104.1 CoA transferase [Methylobacterium nodulans]